MVELSVWTGLLKHKPLIFDQNLTIRAIVKMRTTKAAIGKQTKSIIEVDVLLSEKWRVNRFIF